MHFLVLSLQLVLPLQIKYCIEYFKKKLFLEHLPYSFLSEKKNIFICQTIFKSFFTNFIQALHLISLLILNVNVPYLYFILLAEVYPKRTVITDSLTCLCVSLPPPLSAPRVFLSVC